MVEAKPNFRCTLDLVGEDDNDKLDVFYQQAYGRSHIINNSKYHNWQFRDNPFNKTSKKSILIMKNDEIFSHVGLFPYELKVQDTIKNSVWLILGYTLEEYRGKGLFQQMIGYTKNRFSFTTVLNATEDARRVYLKNKWFYFGELNRYIVLLNKKRVEEFIGITINEKQATARIAEYKFRRITTLDDRYEKFWDQVKERYPITTNRTRQYLNWRYLENPLIDYHFMILEEKNDVIGFAVIRIEDNNDELKAARIIDLVVLENYEAHIIKQIINYCYGKVDFIDFFCTGRFYKTELEKEDFFNNLNKGLDIPHLFNPIDRARKPEINLYIKYNEHEINSESWLGDVNNWYIVKGDSDQDRAN